jgi:hypothetical protein
MKEKLLKVIIEDDGSITFVGKSEKPEQRWDFSGVGNFATALKQVFDEIEDWNTKH